MTTTDPDPKPVEPERPAPDDCCRSACTPCVYDIHEEAMERYRKALSAWESRQAGARPPIIADERDVPPYSLPDPLVAADGTAIADAAAWRTQRRPELLELFSREVYGRTPSDPVTMRVNPTSEFRAALDCPTVMREVRLHVERDGRSLAIDILMFVPAASPRPVPAFLSLNFFGNQAVCDDRRIAISNAWMREDAAKGVVDHRASEATRGVERTRWPIAAIVARGYALVTACYGDSDPDFDDGFVNGAHALFAAPAARAPDDWGAIGAWAWGMSRILDVLQADPDIDATRVIAAGHSRLGKAALWAAAQDERFALAISNASGRGGASLARRRFGETVRHINATFPHWFCRNFRQYDDREDALPVDQHELIATIAPRPVLVCSAIDDAWADPRGEFLGARGADAVYRLLGAGGLDAVDMPAPGSLIASTIGYHVRPGGHDVTALDWNAFLDFADAHLGR